MSYAPRIASLLLCPVLFVGSSVAETVVSPAAFADQEGRRWFDDGSERPPSSVPNEKSSVQIIYHSSTFSSVASGPIRITEINLRPDGARAVGDTQGYDNLKLILSVTKDTPDEASNKFADNLASIISESVIAYDQAWESVVRNPVPAQGTRPFDFQIELTRPFEFDPSDGHLLVEWMFGLPTNLAPHTSFDSDSVFGQPPTEFPEQRSLFALGENPTISASGGEPVVTQFRFEAVPEPTLGYVTVLCILGLGSRFRRKR